MENLLRFSLSCHLNLIVHFTDLLNDRPANEQTASCYQWWVVAQGPITQFLWSCLLVIPFLLDLLSRLQVFRDQLRPESSGHRTQYFPLNLL